MQINSVQRFRFDRLYQRMSVSGLANSGGVSELHTAQGMGPLGESPAFGVRQAQVAIRKLGCEHPILFCEGSDNMLLVSVEPSRNHGDDDLQNHDGASDWSRR